MKNRAILSVFMFAFVLAFVLASSASAHVTGPNPDEDGDGYLEVYRASNYHGGWATYKKVANRQLRAYAPEVPRIRMVHSKARAEVWIHKADWPNTHCSGTSKENPGGLDEVITDASCPDPATNLVGHEVGHIYGLADGPIYWTVDGVVVRNKNPDRHRSCTSYWQKRSVNVGETPHDGINGCRVLITGFGPRDLRELADYY